MSIGGAAMVSENRLRCHGVAIFCRSLHPGTRDAVRIFKGTNIHRYYITILSIQKEQMDRTWSDYCMWTIRNWNLHVASVPAKIPFDIFSKVSAVTKESRNE